MRAMVLTGRGAGTLEAAEREAPVALPGEVRLRVRACGVCRADLHVVAGELPDAEVPLVPGHAIVGIVDEIGDGVHDLAPGDRVGVSWLGYACEVCEYRASGRENLCAEARYTGYNLDGGFAEYAVVDARYAFKLPQTYADVEIAPLLCAGLLGYRAYRLTGESRRLGLFGFETGAELVAQVAIHDGRQVFVFTPDVDHGDAGIAIAGIDDPRAVARALGATWAGGLDEAPPQPLDAAIVFTPHGAAVPIALSRVAPGGVVVCAGFFLHDVPAFPSSLIAHERTLRSAASVTRQDARDFLAMAGRVMLKTRVHEYHLEDANLALADLREGRVAATPVLIP